MSKASKVYRALGQLRVAAKHYNTSLWFQLRRARRLHDHSLFSLEDILFWGLTDPSIPFESIDDYMSREARVRLQAAFNNRGDSPLVDDKARFYRLCMEQELPIPPSYGILRGGVPAGSLDGMLGYVSLRELPVGSFVAKPAWGSKGQGLVFFARESECVTFDGRALPFDNAEAELMHLAGDDYMVIQAAVEPHAELAALSGTEGVQSARVVSFLAPSGDVHLLFARFKFLTQGNLVDNFADGETGNLISAVDVDSGRVTATYRKQVGAIGLEPVALHPDTGAALAIQLPAWEDVQDVVRKAARSFPTLPLLAWDIGFAQGGPVILEANQDWEIFPIAPYREPPAGSAWRSAIQGSAPGSAE